MLTRTGYITGPQKYGTSTSCCGHCGVYTLLITGAPWRDHITRYCDSSIGYQYDEVYTSRSLSWFSNAWLVWTELHCGRPSKELVLLHSWCICFVIYTLAQLQRSVCQMDSPCHSTPLQLCDRAAYWPGALWHLPKSTPYINLLTCLYTAADRWADMIGVLRNYGKHVMPGVYNY